MKYRIYIDEVGNPDLESSDNPNHRFLSLTGVILDLRYIEAVVHPQMEALKAKYFHSHPDEPVIFHRKEMINAKPPFDILKESKTLRRFDEALLALLAAWEYTVISVCLDKKSHKETYTTWRYDPYHYCLAILLERFVFFLNQHGAQGDVMAESRGGKEDMRLKSSFERMWEAGTEYVEPVQFQNALTSKQLKVKQKMNNISGLQLADLVAHPSRNEILQEQGLLGKEMGFFAQKVVKILQHKYYQREGKIFGKKFL
ncbi:MAG TPA: DUF3800 domain-containing protein [Thermodesulfovibrionales bacterium]|nr:DUF3800 domain-containing protein [Thermodesulfovibrionales bacterium]